MGGMKFVGHRTSSVEIFPVGKLTQPGLGIKEIQILRLPGKEEKSTAMTAARPSGNQKKSPSPIPPPSRGRVKRDAFCLTNFRDFTQPYPRV